MTRDTGFAIDPELRIGVIFDDNVLAERSIGDYITLLNRFCRTKHLRPERLPQVNKEDYDLFIHIDDGLDYDVPNTLYPRALWLIGDRLNLARDIEKAHQYDWVFVNHKVGAEAIREAGVINVWGLEHSQGMDEDDPIKMLLRTVTRVPGLRMSYVRNVRNDLLALVPEAARAILDIGCATGRLGAAIKERQICRVTGIEIHAGAAERASTVLDRVFVGPAETLLDSLSDGEFDCIIMGDVLEHMVDPWNFLYRVRRKLQEVEHSRVILSLPNVAHWTVILPLLQGDWRYTDAGILDSTHMRFFTPQSMVRMVNGAGMEIDTIQGVVIPKPPGLTDIGLAKGWLDSGLADLYQVLIKCKLPTS